MARGRPTKKPQFASASFHASIRRYFLEVAALNDSPALRELKTGALSAHNWAVKHGFTGSWLEEWAADPQSIHFDDADDCRRGLVFGVSVAGQINLPGIFEELLHRDELPKLLQVKLAACALHRLCGVPASMLLRKFHKDAGSGVLNIWSLDVLLTKEAITEALLVNWIKVTADLLGLNKRPRGRRPSGSHK